MVPWFSETLLIYQSTWRHISEGHNRQEVIVVSPRVNQHQTIKKYGGAEVQHHVFFSIGTRWRSMHGFALRGPEFHWRGSWMGPRAGVNMDAKRKIPAGNRTPIVQSIETQYTDWAIPNTLEMYTIMVILVRFYATMKQLNLGVDTGYSVGFFVVVLSPSRPKSGRDRFLPYHSNPSLIVMLSFESI
jgi:hypothetical protein